MARQRPGWQGRSEVRRFGIPAALALTAVALLAGFRVASAASLGGLRSRTLLAQSTATGAITETFSYPAGTSLHGRTSPSGGVWTVTGGSIAVTSAQTAQGSTTGTVYGTVPFSSCNTQIGVDIRSSGSSTFGLLINAATSGRPSTAVLYNNAGGGTITLSRVAVSGARTTLASVSQVGGGNQVRFLVVRYYNGTYTVSLDNVTVLTYVVPSADRPAIEAACNVGIMVDSDTKSAFDNFQAYAL